MISSLNFDVFLGKKTETPTSNRTVIDDLLTHSEELKDVVKDIGKVPEDWTKYTVKGVCSLMVPRHIISVFDEVKDIAGNNEDSLGTISLKGNKEARKLLRERLAGMQMKDGVIEFFVNKDFLFKSGADQMKSYIAINISSLDKQDELWRVWKTETLNITNAELEKLDSITDAGIRDNTGSLNSVFSKKMKLDSIEPFEKMNYNGLLVLKKKYRFHFSEFEFIKMAVESLCVKKGGRLITINISYLDQPFNENIKYIDKIMSSIEFSPLLKTTKS